MGENTKIQWAHHTFNHVRGCEKIAPGCANCYAEAQSKRNPGTLGIWGPNGTRVLASEAMWRQPVKWDLDAERRAVLFESDPELEAHERPRVFCASLADVFEDWPRVMRDAKGKELLAVDPHDEEKSRWYTMDYARARLFKLIDATPNLDWLLLTKRPENVRRMWCSHANTDGRPPSQLRRENVWLGTSVACQEDADRNIPELLKCRDLCAKLFVSVEPLVGPVDLSPWIGKPSPAYEVLSRFYGPRGFDKTGSQAERTEPKLDWVIVGGESGPHARPCNVEWIRSIVRQCKVAEFPWLFVKQLGARVYDNDGVSRCSWPGLTEFQHNNDDADDECEVLLKDPKGGDQSEWPEDLRVREVPA